MRQDSLLAGSEYEKSVHREIDARFFYATVSGAGMRR
jgi:hypothetical protein